MFCYLSGHFRDAEVQYVALGGPIKPWSEFPFVPLGELKRNREHNARFVLSKEGTISFPGWHFLGSTYDDGEWRVNIPVEVTHQEKPGLPGADASQVWTCTAGGITHEIRVLGIPPALGDDGPGRVLDAARTAFAKERGAEPRDPRDTLLAARPAQEYDVEVPGGMQLRVDAIVLGNWLFRFSVQGSKRDVAGRAANEFFDSFAFQPKAKPSPDASKP